MHTRVVAHRIAANEPVTSKARIADTLQCAIDRCTGGVVLAAMHAFNTRVTVLTFEPNVTNTATIVVESIQPKHTRAMDTAVGALRRTCQAIALKSSITLAHQTGIMTAASCVRVTIMSTLHTFIAGIAQPSALVAREYG
jgi:hypothetical protein